MSYVHIPENYFSVLRNHDNNFRTKYEEIDDLVEAGLEAVFAEIADTDDMRACGMIKLPDGSGAYLIQGVSGLVAAAEAADCSLYDDDEADNDMHALLQDIVFSFDPSDLDDDDDIPSITGADLAGYDIEWEEDALDIDDLSDQFDRLKQTKASKLDDVMEEVVFEWRDAYADIIREKLVAAFDMRDEDELYGQFMALDEDVAYDIKNEIGFGSVKAGGDVLWRVMSM